MTKIKRIKKKKTHIKDKIYLKKSKNKTKQTNKQTNKSERIKWGKKREKKEISKLQKLKYFYNKCVFGTV